MEPPSNVSCTQHEAGILLSLDPVPQPVLWVDTLAVTTGLSAGCLVQIHFRHLILCYFPLVLALFSLSIPALNTMEGSPTPFVLSLEWEDTANQILSVMILKNVSMCL